MFPKEIRGFVLVKEQKSYALYAKKLNDMMYDGLSLDFITNDKITLIQVNNLSGTSFKESFPKKWLSIGVEYFKSIDDVINNTPLTQEIISKMV
jgi:hypothetical protein